MSTKSFKTNDFEKMAAAIDELTKAIQESFDPEAGIDTNAAYSVHLAVYTLLQAETHLNMAYGQQTRAIVATFSHNQPGYR